MGYLFRYFVMVTDLVSTNTLATLAESQNS